MSVQCLERPETGNTYMMIHAGIAYFRLFSGGESGENLQGADKLIIWTN
jgi:hypothetical protein